MDRARTLIVVLALSVAGLSACSSDEDQLCGGDESYEGVGCLPPGSAND